MKLKGKMTELQLESTLLHRSLTLICYLPPQYDPSNAYPLLISQDGRDYIQLGRLARISDQLIDEGKIRDVVIAAIPYENRDQRWELYHPDGRFHHAYMRALVEEVLPLIKEHYAISDLAGERTLIGDSLGGTISLTTALAYPQAFANVVMQSPYIDERIIRRVSESRDITAFSIYHTIGLKETAVKTTKGFIQDFLEPNRNLSRIIKTKHIAQYSYQELDGDHTWRTWQPDVERAVYKMFEKK